MRRGGRELAPDLIETLHAWVQAAPLTANLHSGDLGWHLRGSDETLADAFLLWEDDGEPVAFGLAEDTVLRTAVAPDRGRDGTLAEVMTEVMADFDYVDALSGTAARRLLLERGWSTDPVPWVLLYTDLSPRDRHLDDAATRSLDGPDDVAGRVAVQRSAFAPGSSFSAELWAQMTAGPTYDGRFEMVTWTPTGEPAAAATGWYAGPGRCAILEPVGTHQDYQRQGYGRRVNRAVMAALTSAGTSGVRVHTPASNATAVATYESCGLRQVDWTTAVRAPR